MRDGRKNKARHLITNEQLDGSSNYEPRPPKSFTIKFRDDYDIRQVDREVRNSFEYHKTKVKDYRQKIIELNQQLEHSNTIRDYQVTIKEIKRLEDLIDDINQGKDAVEYRRDTQELLQEYVKRIKPHQPIDITESNECTLEDLTQEDVERVKIIIDYLKIAAKYIKVDWIHEVKVDDGVDRCEGCNVDLTDLPIDCEGAQTCPICGVVRYISQVKEVMDTLPEATNSKEYCDESNFKKAFKRFICGQEVNYDISDVVEKLDQFFQKDGYRPASYYRELEVTNGWKKEGTSVQLLVYGLKNIKRNDLYEDYNMLGVHLWGWETPDAAYLEDIIMSDYRETQEVYASMDKQTRGRSSCLSTQLRLFKHLQLRGFECEINDFKVPIQHDTLRKQERLWEIMCNNCSNPSIYYIRSANT